MQILTKICTKCKIEKSYSEFYLHSKNTNKIRAECKLCSHYRKNEYYKNNEYVRIKKRNISLKFAHGAAVLKLIKPNLCPICQRTEAETIDSKQRSFVVDHCHKSGKVRSYICTQCNKGLGFFRDDLETLQRAINYLTTHQGD